jgi:hypothetical protein
MNAMILVCVCLLLVGICFGNISYSPKIVPVTEINLDSFMGRWYYHISNKYYSIIPNKYYTNKRYQMYASLIPSQTYEKDLVCIGLTLFIINQYYTNKCLLLI